MININSCEPIRTRLTSKSLVNSLWDQCEQMWLVIMVMFFPQQVRPFSNVPVVCIRVFPTLIFQWKIFSNFHSFAKEFNFFLSEKRVVCNLPMEKLVYDNIKCKLDLCLMQFQICWIQWIQRKYPNRKNLIVQLNSQRELNVNVLFSKWTQCCIWLDLVVTLWSLELLMGL